MLFVLGLMINIVFPLYYDIVTFVIPPNTHKECISRDASVIAQLLLVIIDAGYLYFFPCIIVFLFNALLIGSLIKSKFDGEKHGGKALRKDTDIAKSLLLISTLYLVTNLPYSVIWVWYYTLDPQTLSPQDVQRILYLMHASTWFTTINFASNFWIYSSKFDFFWPTLKSIFG